MEKNIEKNQVKAEAILGFTEGLILGLGLIFGSFWILTMTVKLIIELIFFSPAGIKFIGMEQSWVTPISAGIVIALLGLAALRDILTSKDC